MRKLWALAFKEIKLAFRDLGSIVTMLVTPLALTLAMAAAFGTGGSDPLSDIPVLLIDHDQSTLSWALVDVFRSDSVGDLVALEVVEDEASARRRVQADEVAVLVVIPPDFGERMFPLGAQVEQITGIDLANPDAKQIDAIPPEQQEAIGRAFWMVQGAPASDPAVVEIYASPDWQISTAVVKGIVTQGLEMINLQVQGTTQLMAKFFATGGEGAGGISSFDWQGMSSEETDVRQALPVRLEILSSSGRRFSWLDYSASSLAILFLMFAVTSGGRTLLAEREGGTLPRLLVSPTPSLTILVGKMAGIVLTGVLQVAILWGATSLIGAYWGPPAAVIVTIFGLVLGASSVGALISAWAKTPGQAGAIGTAITLVAGALSGSFFERWNLPLWVQRVSLITPNAWGIEIFARLQMGQGLAEAWPWLAGLVGLTVVYYVVAVFGFRRQLG